MNQNNNNIKVSYKVPVYDKLIKDIIRKINQGELKPGQFITPENALKKEYRISRSTVRKALLELVKRGLLEKQPGKGTIVKSILGGPSQSPEKKNMVLVLTSSFFGGHLYTNRIVAELLTTATTHNWSLVCEITDSKRKSKSAGLLSTQLAGICAIPTGIEKADDFVPGLPSNIPCFILGRKYIRRTHEVEDNKIFYIAIDHFQGALNAVNHLIILGHKRIAIVNSPFNTEPFVERLQGYITAHQQKGLEVENNLILNTSEEYKNVYQMIKEMLEQPNPPTALFIAMGGLLDPALRVIEEKKIRIPEELSVIVYDEIREGLEYKTPISAIRQPLTDMAKLAIENIYYYWNSPKERGYYDIILPPELVLRNSCAPPKQ